MTEANSTAKPKKRIPTFSFRLGNVVENITKIFFGLSIAIIIGAFCIVFYQEYTRNAYTVLPFVVPKFLEESGLNGEVLGRKIIDELKQLRHKASSEQDDEAGFETADQDETVADLTLGTTGLSISQLVEITKALLGRPTRKITGELVLLDSTLQLTLRVTGNQALTIEQPFRNANLVKSLDTLFENAGDRMAKILMPLTLGIYYQNTYREKQAIELLEYCLLAPPHEDDKYAATHLAALLFAEKDTAGAMDKIQTALQIDNNFAEAYLAWAKILKAQKDSAGVVNKYQQAANIDDENARIYRAWGNFLGSRKDSAGAVRQFMQALKVAPEDAATYTDWAYFLRVERKNYDEAIKKYKIAIALQPTKAPAYVGLARAYRSKKDTTRAIELLRQSIAIDNYYRVAYTILANTLSSQGKYEEANTVLKKAMLISPRYVEIYNVLGLNYRRMKDYKQSAYYFERSLAIQERANTLRNYAMTLYLAKDYEKALTTAQKAFQLSKTGTSHAILGVAYAGVGNRELFLEHSKAAAKKQYNFNLLPAELAGLQQDKAFVRVVKEGKALAKKGKQEVAEE